MTVSDRVRIEFDRDLITEMLLDNEPRTMRMTELGKPDKDGLYQPTFISESMDPDVPEPWIFDGYRRVYDDGKALPIWQARAVDLTDAEFDEKVQRTKASFEVGQGATMVAARDALLEALRK